MNYRSRDDIVSVILDAANGGGLTKTKIMYQAYLSHDQMKEYLSVLIENDLLGYDVYTRKFKTTEKGLRFLDTYGQMDDMIKDGPLSPPPTTTSLSYPQEEEEVQQEQV
jgi:predicted transcriptional regulator